MSEEQDDRHSKDLRPNLAAAAGKLGGFLKTAADRLSHPGRGAPGFRRRGRGLPARAGDRAESVGIAQYDESRLRATATNLRALWTREVLPPDEIDLALAA